MSTLADVSTQVSQLSDTLKQTNTLITRLSKLSFEPGSEPLSDQTSVRTELAQDIADSLKQLEEDLDLLSQEAEDLNAPTSSTTTAATLNRHRDSERDRERTRLAAHLARLSEDLKSSRSHFRRAQLTAKRASEAGKQRERELVFSRLSNPSPPPSDDRTNGSTTPDLFAGRRKLGQQKQLTKDELEVDASTTVTAALRRTHDLLSTELSRSRFAQETFDQSTAALNELGERYSSLDSVLKGSRELLSTLVRSQKSDTWYLESALYILLGTLAWLFVHRILWGPFWQLPLFVWRWFVWPVFATILSVTGIYNPGAAGTRSASLGNTKTRPPLIVQPSASQGSQPKFPEGMAGVNIPAGSGGEKAKVGKQGLAGEMSEKIGKMAEDSSRQAGEGEDEGKGGVRRGDGTLLEERADVKANPKKKMFEADVEDAKHEESERRKRDEL